MITADAALNAFVDTNILVIVAFLLWRGAQILLGAVGLYHAHATQLKLLNGVFLAIVASPFLVALWSGLQSAGIAGGPTVNISDLVVSHYLNGGFAMNASEFERLLTLRDRIILDVIRADGWFARGLIAAFVAGLLIGVGRLAISLICLRRLLYQSYAWRHFGRVHLRLSDSALVPFSTRGLRRYYVVIPAHMLGHPRELKVALAHELQHLRQGDIEWEILLEALRPLFFLNPAFHLWKTRVEELRELSCDQQVLAKGRVGLRDYCETLLSVSHQMLRRDRVFAVAVPKVTLVTAERRVGGLERRVHALLLGRRLRHTRVIFAALMIPLLGAVFLTAVAIQRPADWSQDRLMLSTVVNLERLDAINRQSFDVRRP